MSVPSAAEIVESVRTTLPLSKEEAATYLVDIKSPFYVEGVSKETAIQLLDKVGGIPKCIQDYSDKIKQEAEEKSKAKNPKEKKKGRKAFDLKTPKVCLSSSISKVQLLPILTLSVICREPSTMILGRWPLENLSLIRSPPYSRDTEE